MSGVMGRLHKGARKNYHKYRKGDAFNDYCQREWSCLENTEDMRRCARHEIPNFPTKTNRADT